MLYKIGPHNVRITRDALVVAAFAAIIVGGNIFVTIVKRYGVTAVIEAERTG